MDIIYILCIFTLHEEHFIYTLDIMNVEWDKAVLDMNKLKLAEKIWRLSRNLDQSVLIYSYIFHS